jgi:hypothetical protein
MDERDSSMAVRLAFIVRAFLAPVKEAHISMHNLDVYDYWTVRHPPPPYVTHTRALTRMTSTRAGVLPSGDRRGLPHRSFCSPGDQQATPSGTCPQHDTCGCVRLCAVVCGRVCVY